jgi:hypothetical protein
VETNNPGLGHSIIGSYPIRALFTPIEITMIYNNVMIVSPGMIPIHPGARDSNTEGT